jgi:O-antigen ligase
VRPRETLAWIVVALLFIDLTFFSGASNFLASPQSRILNQVLIVGAVTVGGILALRSRAEVRSRLLLPGAAWVGATVIATFTSQRPAASLEAVALLLIAAPAYFVIKAVLAHPGLRPRIDWLVIVSSTVFVVAYLVQGFTQWLSWWSVAGPSIPPLRPGDVGLTVGTVNAVALYLELLVPIAVWLSWSRWRSRPFSVGLAVVSAFALLVTGSRGAWLGAIVAAAVALAIGWRSKGLSLRALVSSRPRRIGALVVVALLIVLLPILPARLLSGDAGRFELWSAAWSMFTSSPLVGVGPGAWPGVRPLTPISDDILAVLATSHNSALQVLAETGLIGALAAAWLVVAIGRLAWRAVARGPTESDRTMAVVASVSLVAAAVHSIVDAQFHLPAVVLLVLQLVARLELVASSTRDADREATPERTTRETTTRAVVAFAGAAALIGVVRLVPIDIAMVRAAIGNQALDRGDAAAALVEFDAAVGLHELAPYALGQALARKRLGDDRGSADALAATARAEPFTFVLVQQAALADDPEQLWSRVESAGPYDATASVNLALQRVGSDPIAAGHDLAAGMIQVPTLVFSSPPDGLFDNATWREAQAEAIRGIGATDPITAATVAILAGRADDAATQRAAIAPGPEADAVDLLQRAMVDGAPDLEAAHRLLGAAPASPGVQFVLWQLGFRAGSQPLLDAVRAVAVPVAFNVPLPPMELVTDGRVDADYSARLPRWPQASDGRNGPKRPYIDGFITIEPVFRPKP